MNIKSHTSSTSVLASNKAFTLLELILVLLIMAISTALVLPRLGGSLPGVKLKAGARKVAASLRSARSQAVSQNQPYAMVLFTDQQLVGVMPLNIVEKWPHASAPEGYRYYRPPDNVRIEGGRTDVLKENKDRFVIVFYASGASSGGHIILRDDRQRRYEVNVDIISGRIAIEQT